MKFQCPKCESTMELKEDNHVCPECEHSMSLTEADAEFDKGNLVGLVEDKEVDELLDEAKKKIMKKEEEGDDELEDDEKDKDEVVEDGHEKDDEKDKDEVVEDGHEKDDEEKLKKEAAHAKKVKKESVENSLKNIEINIDEDVNALFGKEDLSEEFKAKAGTIYETAIKSNLRKIAELIVEDSSKKLDEAIKSNKKELVEKMDKYLDYAIKTWMEENKVALESKARVEMNESFMNGLSVLFKEHWIEVPEGRYDVLEGMAKEVENLKEQLDVEINKNINGQTELNESLKREILVEATEDLADTEKEKLVNLAEEVKFKTEDQFREKIGTIKEAYFNKVIKPNSKEETEDDNNNQNDHVDNDMISGVLSALKSSNKQ